MAPSSTSSSIVTAAAAAASTAAVAVATLAYVYWDDPIFHHPRLPKQTTASAGQQRHSSGTSTSSRIILGTLPTRMPIIGDTIDVVGGFAGIHDMVCTELEKNQAEADARGLVAGGVSLKLPFTPAIVCSSDPAVVEHVLKTKFPIYNKGHFFFSRTSDVLGHGIFAVDGEEWKYQRKTSANLFNIKNFKEFVGVVFVEEMGLFSNRLERAVSNNEIVNLSELFFRFTLDGFCRIGFGENLNSLEQEKPVPFATAFDDAQTRLVQRFLTPLWSVVETLSLSGFKHSSNVQTIKDFGRKLVEKRLAYLKAGGDPNAFSDALSYMMATEIPSTGKPPTPDQLVEYVINLIIAGRDTTAQALSWAVLLLHRNPAAKAALLAEIDAALPDSAALPSYDQVRSLAYANAVFHETLRLYPSVPLEIKQLSEDDVLPNGVHLPRGALCSWSPYSMGRSERIWGPDAKEFRPERWLEMDKAPSPWVYPVFNGGPRVCLGKNMAELEGVFVLVSLLRRFDVDVVDHESVTYQFSLTLPMKDGMRVRLKKRE
ncbi:cytochrome P450 [Zopfochytrium polystomum]|nr:cytochrome P450 [Zopfochytrium polystomum]